MGNELSNNKFSLPTFEEALRMNDSFASFLCPYCGKWHRAEKETSKHVFKSNDIAIYNSEFCSGILSVNCSNPLYFSSYISYKVYFDKDSINYEVVPLSVCSNYVTRCNWYNYDWKNFSGAVPYSSFHVLPGYTSDMDEVKYVCDITFSSLQEVCGVHDMQGCTKECYFYNCRKGKTIQLGFGLKYNPGATILDIDTRLKRVAYKYLEQLPKQVYSYTAKTYAPLITTQFVDERSLLTTPDLFDNWCRMDPEGYNWLYHFVQELLDTALTDEYDKEESLTDILDLKL